MARNKTVKIEGYWNDSAEYLPTPKKNQLSKKHRQQVANRLVRRQESVKVKSIAHKGISRDYFDDSIEFPAKDFVYGPWKWPAGFDHMIREYGVRPSDAFLQWLKIDPDTMPVPEPRVRRTPSNILNGRRRRNRRVRDTEAEAPQAFDLRAEVNKHKESLSNLYFRWQDEQQYEDIKDYATALRKSTKWNITKMTGRPFAVFIEANGGKYKVTVTQRGIKGAVLQEPKPAAVEEPKAVPTIKVTDLRDKRFLKRVNTELQEATQKVLDKYGLAAEVKGGRIVKNDEGVNDGRTFKPNLMVKVTAESNDADRDKFGKQAIAHGMRGSDYLRTFAMGDTKYRVVGFSRSKDKPVVCVDVITKRKVRMPAEDVKAALGYKDAKPQRKVRVAKRR